MIHLKLGINIPLISGDPSNVETLTDEQEYVTIIPCYHFNVTGNRIDNIDMNYLIITSKIKIAI